MKTYHQRSFDTILICLGTCENLQCQPMCQGFNVLPWYNGEVLLCLYDVFTFKDELWLKYEERGKRTKSDTSSKSELC